jgi:hypothetical protein
MTTSREDRTDPQTKTPRIPTDRESKVIFSFTPGYTQLDKVPVLTFMMSQRAWDYMQNGLCHDFDLTRVDIPLKILIGRCTDHAHGMAILEQANGGALKAGKVKDVRHIDVGIEPDEKADQ